MTNTDNTHTVATLEARDAAMRLIRERGIDATDLYQALVNALEETYAGMEGAPRNFHVSMDPSTFSFSVVSFDNDPEGEVLPLPLDLITRVAAAKFGEILKGQVTFAEKESAVREFEMKQGTIVEGVVRSVTDTHSVVEVSGVAGELRIRDQIPGEILKVGDVVSCFLTAVAARRDLPLLLSRSSRDTVYALMLDRIAELRDGSVEILELDREAGRRTKVVVASNGGVRDAVAAVVGTNGRKINSIQDELANERIDVCGWSEDPYMYLADLLGVEVSDIRNDLVVPTEEEGGEAVVFVQKKDMGRVKGTRGSNVRMAEKISGIRVHIQEVDNR